MDYSALRAHLDREFGLLRAAAAATAPDRKVPSCPAWTAADLVKHVTEVYGYKTPAIRAGARRPARPAGGRAPSALDKLAAAHAEFGAELDVRSPDDPARTSFTPDRTVGAVLRRMAHEVAIHRVDAELAAGVDPASVTALDEEFAQDNVDEMLRVFLEFASTARPRPFGDLLARGDRRPVGLTAGPAARWTATVTPDGVRIADGPGADLAGCAATVTAPDASTLALWLWNRLPDDTVRAAGDTALLAQFERLRTAGTR